MNTGAWVQDFSKISPVAVLDGRKKVLSIFVRSLCLENNVVFERRDRQGALTPPCSEPPVNREAHVRFKLSLIRRVGRKFKTYFVAF